jgi:UDP-N-acetylmuramate: L-alanyl-gamma-D-glutamyl-meso-diaminopimelate ligase
MELTPQGIYQQNSDKQRIVITGSGRSKLTSMITQILHTYQRKFDHFADGKLSAIQTAPLIIIESPIAADMIGYKHHVAILTDASENELNELTKFVDATPKSGIILYPETDSKLKAIGSKERADIQSIPYKKISHEVKNGKIILVSSTNEKFPIQLSGDQNLLLLAAAKEILRKIGISSGQFYKAVADIS